MGAIVSKVWLIYTLRDRETEPVAIKLKSDFSNFPAQINGQNAGPGGKFAQKARIEPVVRTQIPLSAQKLIKGHLHVRTMLGKKEIRPKVPEGLENGPHEVRQT